MADMVRRAARTLASIVMQQKPKSSSEIEEMLDKISRPYTDEVREACLKRLAENGEYIALITANPDVKIMFPELRDVYALREPNEEEKRSGE